MLVALAAVLAAYLAHAWTFSHYVNDDAFITFRYSRFVALGRGPYFNVGEPVEGYSNPLFMLLMVPVIALGGEGWALPAARLVGAVSGALTLIVVFALARLLQVSTPVAPDSSPLRSPGPGALGPLPYASAGAAYAKGGAAPWIAGALAAGLIAVSPSYALNSVSGLETTFYGLCVTAGVLLGTLGAHQGRWLGAGVAFAAAVLTRPEAPLVFAVFWCALAASALATRSLASARRLLAIDAAVVGAVFLAHVLLRRALYGGEWLPNTYYAKAGGFWALDAWDYVRAGMLAPFGGLVAVSLAVMGCLLSPRLSPLAPRVLIPTAAVAVCGAGLPFITGTDWMPGERLLMPYLPLAAVLVATGWTRVGSLLAGRRGGWFVPAAAVVSLLVLWAVQDGNRNKLREDSLLRAEGYRGGHVALAEWLRSGAARPGDTIALMDIGVIGYLCIDQRILDITGLTDRHIAQSPGGFLDKQYDPMYVIEQRPRFVVLVISEDGDPTGRPGGTDLVPWTNIEGRLLNHPEFIRWYRRPAGLSRPGEPWLDALARSFGAVRMFQHASPGVFYLLTVFERQEQPLY